MTNVVKIEYTQTAKITLNDIIFHLKTNSIDPLPVINAILNEFEDRVKTFPSSCQISPELLKIGCSAYRECNTHGNYRVIYSFNNSIITVHVILAQKQDIQQALFKCLIGM